MAEQFRIHETVSAGIEVVAVESAAAWAAPLVGRLGGRVMCRYVSMEARGLQSRFTSSAGER